MADSTIDSPAVSRKSKWLLRRLFPSTWIILLLATTSMVLLEVPGRRTGMTTYAHGWPLPYLERDYKADAALMAEASANRTPSVYTAGPSSPAASNAVQISHDYRLSRNELSWSVESKMTPWSTEYFSNASVWHAEIDIVVALLLVTAAAGCYQSWRSRRQRSPFRFRIRTLLAAVAILGLAFSRIAAWHHAVLNEPSLRASLVLQSNGIDPTMSDWMPPRWLPECLVKIGSFAAEFDRVSTVVTTGDLANVDFDQLARFSDLACLWGSAQAINEKEVAQLQRLPGLRELHLYVFGNSTLGGEQINPLNRLDSLEELRLILGRLPLVHLNGFAKLKQLTLITFVQPTEFGPAIQLDQLPALEVLDIEGSREVRFGELPKVRELTLWNLKLSDAALAQLPALPCLQELGMNRVRLDSPLPLACRGQHDLRTITIDNSQISSLNLEDLQNLEELKCEDDVSLQAVQLIGLPKLASAELWGNKVTRIDFRAVTALRDLAILNAHKEGDRKVRSLIALRGLDELSSLESFKLLGAELADEQISAVGHLKYLKTLDLNSSSVRDDHIAKWGPMPRLTELDLGDTDVSDASLPYLKQMPKLTTLRLKGTKITDTAIKALRSSTQLQKVELSDPENVIPTPPAE